MISKGSSETYIAFLRGINVGGHHKVPMAELRSEMGKMGFSNISTILNSGNIIFRAQEETPANLEDRISDHLSLHFQFNIPVVIRRAEIIIKLYEDNPFKGIDMTPDIRLYVSFVKKQIPPDRDLPWTSVDKSFKIIEFRDKMILSALDISISKTPKAMMELENSYGKDITTRNWKTITRIINKI